jgi:hypothetical protein
MADGAGYRVTAIDTDRQGDLYRHLTASEGRALDRPPTKYGVRSAVLYAPGGVEGGDWSRGVDLAIIDTPPAATIPGGLDVVLVPIDGPNAAMNANEIVADALDHGAKRVVLIKNGLQAGGKSFVREFKDMGKDLPRGVELAPFDLPYGPCIKRSSHTNRPAWTDPLPGPDAKVMRDLCAWVLRTTLPPIAKKGAA